MFSLCNFSSIFTGGQLTPFAPMCGRPWPAGDVSHNSGGRLPLLSARPAVTLAALKRAATNFATW